MCVYVCVDKHRSYVINYVGRRGEDIINDLYT